MKRNKYFIISIMICLMITIFSISYIWTLDWLTNNENSIYKDNKNSYASLSNGDQVLSLDTLITLKLKVKDSNLEYTVKSIKAKDLVEVLNGKITLIALENYFSRDNYKTYSSSRKELVFIKDSKFEPNKYYLGSSDDGFVAIFKCNTEGVLFIEDTSNDKSEKKVTSLPQSDIEFLNNFQYKYESKEAAQDELIAICS